MHIEIIQKFIMSVLIFNFGIIFKLFGKVYFWLLNGKASSLKIVLAQIF